MCIDSSLTRFLECIHVLQPLLKRRAIIELREASVGFRLLLLLGVDLLEEVEIDELLNSEVLLAEVD